MTLSTGKRRAHFKATIPTDPNLKPINQWLPENRSFLADFCAWLREGGYSSSAVRLYAVSARLALGYLDKPCLEIDHQHDLVKVRVYLAARALSAATLACYQKGLNRLAHYLRKRKGIPDPEKMVNWDRYLMDIPAWLATDIRAYVAQRSRAWQADNRLQLTRNLLSSLGWFARYAKPGSLRDITPKSWFVYLETRMKMGSKTSSNNTILWTLQSFVRFQQAAGREICERILAVRPQKTGPSLPRDLPVPEIKALLKTATSPLDHAWLILMVYTGLRTCEIRRIEWKNVDFDQYCLRIEQSKGLQDRVVFLYSTAINSLKALPRSPEFVFTRFHRPLSRCYCHSRLVTLGRTCAIKASPHQLRHSAATLLLNAGMSIWGVKEILGHRSVQTTLVYARTYDSTVGREYQMASEKSSASGAGRSLMMVPQ